MIIAASYFKPAVRVSLLIMLVAVLVPTRAVPQAGGRPASRPELDPRSRPLPQAEPVAETRLLMEGLNQANFRGLERLLRERPASAEAWTFIRGQALLIAETGNLLLLRPPRSEGRTIWLDRAGDLRSAATRLARAAAERDYERSRSSLQVLATTCNRCHQSFRVAVRLAPFAQSRDGLRPTDG
jgi:hypothetical protein